MLPTEVNPNISCADSNVTKLVMSLIINSLLRIILLNNNACPVFDENIRCWYSLLLLDNQDNNVVGCFHIVVVLFFIYKHIIIIM